MNIDVLEVQQFDNALRALIREKQALIDEAMAKAPQKIIDVKVHHVLMPWQGTKHGTTFAAFLLFEYHTDAGLVGLDESMALGTLSESDINTLRDRVVGKSPFDPAIRNVLDIAYWDLVGKVVGRPLHEYLSDLLTIKGTRRKRVPFAAYTWARFADIQGQGEVNPSNYPDFCRELVRQGHRTIKFSMVDYEPLSYVDLIHRVREAVGPEIDLRMDSHGSWGPVSALQVARGVEDCNVQFFETPVGGPMEVQWRQMTHLREMTSIPLSSHSWLPPYIYRPGLPRGTASLEQELDLAMLARYDAADISAPDFSYSVVSPLAAWRIYEVARHLGMGLTMHSAYELGVSVMMRMHIASFALAYDLPVILPTWGESPVPGSAYAIDGHYNQWVDDVLLGGKMAYEQGFLTIPDGPGLGVELDAERLERYRYSEEKAAPYRAHQENTLAQFRAERGWIHERNGWRKGIRE
jgi:glucarate dehydratase